MEQVSSLKTGVKYKDTSIGKIPVDWEVLSLKNIALRFYNGGTPDTTNNDYWNGDIPWVTGADFENQKIKRIRRYITDEAVKYSATNIIQRGNLLFVTRTGVGKLTIAPFDIAISQDITGVILDSRKAFPGYIYWYFDYNAERLRSIIQGTSINGLLRGDLESFDIPLAPLPEQKKIAEILTTVDDAIEKTTQVIENTKELKKGLMQKLLTRGIGHKKFKKTEIGEIPVEWKVKNLVDLCVGKPEYGANTAAVDKSDNLPRYIRITDITEDGRLSDATWQSIEKEFAKTYLLKEGDVLFARSGATVGKTYLYREEDGECAFAGYLIRFKPDPRVLLPEFLFYFTHSSHYSGWVKGMFRAGAQPNINAREYSNMLLPKPPVEEQKQITAILTAVDGEIEKEVNHRDQLELLKKGLMQSLLTGKLRATL